MNGPEGDADLWHSIDWRQEEAHVKRLRQRIFRAARNGDHKQVRNLQKLMLRSRANVVTSVRRVTQLSTGKKTAGIDGTVALKTEERGRLVRHILAEPTVDAMPVKRVYIPKANGKQRPLGIPVIRDRIDQARVKNALEPEWEARFEARSYGFRPGRGCHDAIEAIFKVASSKKARRLWVLDADLSAAFDRISHDHLLGSIGLFPGRRRIKGWLRAGVMEQGRFADTVEGTPQGGVVSPLLLNIALHGMAEHIDAARTASGTRGKNVPAALIRYADDFVVFCETESDAWDRKAALAEWLSPRGLTFNEDKTRVVHLTNGFDFLGFNIRRFGDKLIIKPNKDAVRRAKKRIRDTIRKHQGDTADQVVNALNPFLRGWATYYRHAVSSKIFNKIDRFTYRALKRWGVYRHRNKGWGWILSRYWGKFHSGREDRHVFGRSGKHMTKLAWTPIVRHIAVKGDASRDDPELEQYWRRRRPQTDAECGIETDSVPGSPAAGPVSQVRTRPHRRRGIRTRQRLRMGTMVHGQKPGNPRAPRRLPQQRRNE
ncbi:group II intron reverse transcriptase/maturase [Nocardia puris]|uniref:group II intron reverse transcriptase/maturase n=1 Tax=Nocardia puris TaxID=208602 RepID=UPI001E30182F|nr:group II intron reverse transcriptase/maturase [Nocardia puris]